MDEKYTKLDSEHFEPALSEFFEEFITDRKTELKALNKGIKEEDFKFIEDLAHKWKGFSAPYGFAGLAQIAGQLELASKEKNIEKTKYLLKEVLDYLEYKIKNKGF
ncbi:MAG: Hpt domain-containing protein [Bdellovibrionota bacterium]|nr:Hpt domain-containing protein [Bdellovibrionota bacterium]